MNHSKVDAPGVITVPPLIYLVALAIGIALEYLFPVDILPAGVQYPLAVTLIALSGLIMPFVLLQFRNAGTNFDVRKPATTILTEGPFRVSRNPSYLSLSLVYVGIGIAADSFWILGMLIPTLVVMHYGVILREEQYLESKFGEEYLQYKRSVRRWL